MNRYSIAEARNNLGSLVHEAEQRGSVELTRRGQAVAVVVSLQEYKRLNGKGQNFGDLLKSFRQRYEEDLDDEPVFDDVRARSPGREVKF